MPVPRHGGYEEGRACRPAHKSSLGPETRWWKKAELKSVWARLVSLDIWVHVIAYSSFQFTELYPRHGMIIGAVHSRYGELWS
jgi:hypothetical protein